MTALTASAMIGGGLLAGVGAAVAARTPARFSGAMFMLAGIAMTAAAAFIARGAPHTPIELVVVQLAALAVIAYPRLEASEVATWFAIAVVVAFPFAALYGGLGGTTTAWLCVVVIPPVHIWWRLENGELTRPLLWMLAAVITLTFAAGALALFQLWWAFAGFSPLLALLPTAGWVGLAPSEVIDVRGIISAVAVNVAAGLGIFALVVLIATVSSAATETELSPGGLAIVAAGCAFLLEPVRRQLRLVSDELLFGLRPDPLVAAGTLARGIGADPAGALDAVRMALVLPYVALDVEGAPQAESGIPSEHCKRMPLLVDREPVGELVVGLRAGDLQLSANDQKVLEVAAPLLAQMARAHALTGRLHEARALAATSREDERFRLRRDLHDGLGPRLSAIAFRAGAAQLKLGADDDAAAEHLERVRAEAVAAIREIRDLVYGMRPRALDEVGLVEAIRLQAAELRTTSGLAMRIDVAADALPNLPPAVEVAAYRIVMEALTNAARHSGSAVASAGLAHQDGTLALEVRDGGTSSAPWRPGVGMSSMRERAQELGGSLTIVGGVVHAELPLA